MIIAFFISQIFPTISPQNENQLRRQGKEWFQEFTVG